MNKHDIRRICGKRKTKIVGLILKNNTINPFLIIFFISDFDIDTITLANMIIVGLILLG